MFKRIVSFFTAAAVALALTVTAYADGGMITVESYHNSGNTLYCYVHAADEDEMKYVRAAISDGGNLGEEVVLEKASAENCTVSYMLLIDLSWTMKSYSSLISSFAKGLMNTEQDVTVTIAGCGEEFTIEAEGLTTADEVGSALSALQYSHEYSDVFGGVTDALAYLTNGHIDAGSIVNLILITDGDANIKETGTNAEGLEAAAARTKAAITGSPEVIVHAVGLASWEKNAYDAVTSGTGLDLTVRNASSAENCAAVVNDYIDSLLVMKMPLYSPKPDARFNIGIRLLSYAQEEKLEFYQLENVRNIDVAMSTSDAVSAPGGLPAVSDEDPGVPGDDAPAESTPEPAGDEPVTLPEDGDGEGGDITSAEDPGEGEGEGGGDEPAETEPGEVTGGGAIEAPVTDGGADTTTAESAATTSEAATEPASGNTDNTTLIVIIVAGSVVVLAVVIAILVLVLSSKKKGGAAQGGYSGYAQGGAAQAYAPAPVSGDVLLKLQIMSGSVIEKDIMLRDQITIGSDVTCDVVCGDATVTMHNSRIFLNSGYVYIEDMNERPNTTVGGMPINTPVLLNSGDEISVGRVRIRVFY